MYVFYLVLANDTEDEESRVVAAKLFNALANNVGEELLCIYVVPTMASFAEDTSSKVRKAVANNFLNMSRSISRDIFSKKIIPVYEKLSVDSLWIVRKIACLNIHYVAELCNSENIHRLVNTFRIFTEDNQKFVKTSALEVIGYFTNVLPRNLNGTKFILDFYKKTIESLYNSKELATHSDNETFYICAFNFPAILFYFGKESWSELKELYISMTRDKFYKVRKSLASSINEISIILGKEETENTLIPIFDRFYKEEGEIQRAIYKSMPKFLLNINHDKRISYLEKLKKLLHGREKWRIRKECVDLLGNLGGVFDDNTAYEQIFPICIKFCIDEVADVRLHASKSIKSLLVQFLNNDMYKEKVLEILNAFAYSLKSIYRNLFITMIDQFTDSNPDIVLENFMEIIELLSRDKVINTQINIAKLLTKMYLSKHYNNNKIFKRTVLRAKTIKSSIVKEELNIPDDEFKFENENEEKEISDLPISNSEFNNRMSILKEIKLIVVIPGITDHSINKFAKNEVSSSINDSVSSEYSNEGSTNESSDFMSHN